MLEVLFVRRRRKMTGIFVNYTVAVVVKSVEIFVGSRVNFGVVVIAVAGFVSSEKPCWFA